MKYLISLFLFTSLSAYQLPEEFYINEQWFSWTTSFDVKTKEEAIGTVNRKFFSWTVEYDFYDTDNEFQAKARKRFFSLGASFDITDAEERHLGNVDEYLFSFYPKFDMFDANNTLLATATLNFWGTKYQFITPEDKYVIAEMTRPFFALKNNWTVRIFDHSYFGKDQIDPKMMIVVATFQTDKEHWAAQQASSQCKCNQKEVQNLIDITDQYLVDQPLDATLEDHHEKRREVALSQLLPLLEGDQLTESQKDTLSIMLNATKM